MRRAVALALWLAIGPIAAHAVEPDEILPNAALESRARAISTGLRCLVCQNQSIDDSAAPLARDLRVLVRERLQSGDSDDAVRAFIVARYGQFVLLKPPFDIQTLLLWGTPAIVLALGAVGAALSLRRRNSAPSPPPLSGDEQAEVDALLGRKPS